jgi:hypothetical protein
MVLVSCRNRRYLITEDDVETRTIHDSEFVGYHVLVTGNLQEARQAREAWAQSYPRDPRAYGPGYINKASG